MTVPDIVPFPKKRSGAAGPEGPETSPTPAKVSGIRHLFAAFGYSLSGASRLWRETAFRHELLMGAALFALFGYGGAPLAAFMVLGVLMLALLAVEAINTAIEEIVDRISPERSDTARNAKDLGSFAVLCLLAANALYACYVLFPLLWP